MRKKWYYYIEGISMRRIKKRRRLKWKNIFVTLIMIVCMVTLSISLINIFDWKKDSDNTLEQIDKIQNITIVEEVVDEEEVEIIEQEEELDKFNPYWDYIKMNLINVDFSELKLVNSDTKGWIQVNGTNINYPFVQANNNEYYLTRSFDKSYNEAGWVYMDYRNNIDDISKNTIIYAHGRNDKTMFGSLRTILTNGFLKNKNNFVIKLSTEKENTLWQLFSVYRIPTTSDYLQVDFYDNTEFVNFTSMLTKRSDYDFKTSVGENYKILTLSTCYNNDDKIVLHAKLIKKENK